MKKQKKATTRDKSAMLPRLSKAALWAHARRKYPDIVKMSLEDLRIALFQSLQASKITGQRTEVVRNGRIKTSVLPLLWQYDSSPPKPHHPLSYIQQYMQQKLLESVPSGLKDERWYDRTVGVVKAKGK